MDPLIRSAELGPLRTRLSTQGLAPARGAAHDDPAKLHARLREEIERSVRAELGAEARVAAEAERERAHAQGHAEGLAEGRGAALLDAARARVELQGEVQRALQALREAHAAALSGFEAGVGRVAFAAVCKLVGRHAATQTFVQGLVEQVCAPLRADAGATARLHPRDIATLRDLVAGDEMAVGALGLKVVPDDTLALGGCIVETSAGDAHGDLESQLRRLHAVLAGDHVDGAADGMEQGDARA
jgi:flagellar assembly protein FliH